MKINVVLFGLTGFANPVIKALVLDSRVNLVAVFTKKYTNPFPYYSEQQITDLCALRKIKCYTDIKISNPDGIKLIKTHRPDLIIVSSFNQIIKKDVIDMPLGIVNIHPSLLPKYRGACPTNAVLLNGDAKTGVTIHYLTEEIDSGSILMQEELLIDKSDNDSTLRKKTSILASEMIPELINKFTTGKKPLGKAQDNKSVSYAKKPTVEDGYLDSCLSLDELINKIRALNPFPGTSILDSNNKRVFVDKYKVLVGKKTSTDYDDNGYIEISIDSNLIRLYKAHECSL